MKTLKIVLTSIILINLLGTPQLNAQNDIKKLENLIKNKKNQVSANEEILSSGVKALKRVTANLQVFKKSKKATKQEVNRKEKIVANMQNRLTKLNTQIDSQKQELTTLERKLARKTKRNTPKKVTASETKNTNTFDDSSISNTANELAVRKQKLEEARKKIEEARKAREIAYLKEQEALRLEVEKLEQLDNQIKAEEKSIVKEKSTLISDYEDDISINEEILTSGKEGLTKMKTKLNTVKKDPTTSKESIARKEAIIVKIEERLNKIQQEINTKKVELAKLKA